MENQVTLLTRQLFDAYRTGDRATLESLLREDFTFTSPYDDHIDKKTYLERCWPNHAMIAAHHIRALIADENSVFVLYDCELRSGATFRNTEYLTFDDGGMLRSVEVFFGDPPAGVSRERYTDFLEQALEGWQSLTHA